ncbi:hypothetical protein HDU81_010919 [Chytriomyces hyalinus]|nr:hypothetical protein HDU81_010919 [Chytriomyces hyalinus]
MALTVKWKLDVFAHQSELEEVEDSMPKSRGVADKDVKVSMVPNTTRSKPADAPLTASLTVNAYYVLFGLNLAVVLFYLGLLMYNGGAVRSAKNILLLIVLTTSTLYQLFSAMDVTFTPTTTSYLRFVTLSLTIIAFLVSCPPATPQIAGI